MGVQGLQGSKNSVNIPAFLLGPGGLHSSNEGEL